ncbi:TatD family hydrolase [Flavobacterium terrae]|uniref:TatD DNase family protein n=1 Tax=Flavobacterium terrae TaxID=415425 RepID=A0A1M6HCB4_9FLAO|nr:TatD family hydrolase [Flavobacterium terrae]SHJ19821.1 TatD DNase family protein [Flavobacterium terrae]
MLYNLHTHKKTELSNVLEVVNQYPNEFDGKLPYYSIGIHPWYINLDNLEDELNIIEDKLQLKNCLALGESGLDKRIEIPMDIQLQVFEKQLVFAKKHKKPVILHCVSAYQEVIEVKKRMQIETPMIIHGFSKNWQVAKSLLDNGFYLSFGKYLLRNSELSEVFEQVPNDRFFLETDRVEESIIEVYQKASDIKKISIEKQVEENFKTVFGLSPEI